MAVAPKAKRRNSERRKEHSRDAARSRRSREADVFLDLAQEIPLPYDSVKLLDKTSIIRLTITYLRLRTLLADDLSPGNDSSSITSGHHHLEQKLNQLYHRALHGFLMVVASDGDVLFVTDNIASFLGLTQFDVMGQSIYDLSHPCDHDEIREMIGAKTHPSDDDVGQRRDIFVRMKSTITSKGRNVNIKSASYKVISCSGHLRTVRVSASGGDDETMSSFVVIIGQSIGHPLNVDVPLDSRTFVTRHSLDMKFTECDDSVHKLLGYRANELIGQSMYSYHHALDTETLDKTFKTLFCKGQASTGLYRFLAQRGGFVWIETHATVINNVATDKPECVVCLNYVVSGVECENVVFDAIQLRPRMSPPQNDTKKCDDGEDANDTSLVLEICPDAYKDDEQDSEQTCMQFVTEKILEQAVKEKDDTDSSMIHRISCYLLDPSSEMSSSTDQSLYSINNRPTIESHDVKTSDMVSQANEDGMTKNLSNSSLYSLLDKMEDGMEMRAPYIPMDDLVFSSVDTPLVQSYVNKSFSGLMNSDPLLPSISRDLPDPFSSLFTMNLSETQSSSSITQRSTTGAKRAYPTPDAIDLTAAPCKVPRLDGTFSAIDRSSARQAPVSTVNMLTGPVIHVPTFTASQKQMKTIGVNNPKEQSAFSPVGNLMGTPEVKRPAAGEIGSGGQQAERPPPSIVYLLLNGQLTPVTIATTDQGLPAARCDAGKVQMLDDSSVGGKALQGVVKLQPGNRDVQSGVSFRGGDSVGHGGAILDLTSSGSRGMDMAPAEVNISAPQMDRPMTTMQSKPTFLGSNNMRGLARSVGNGPQQMMTVLGGQERAESKPSSTLPASQLSRAVDGLVPGLTTEQLLRLIAPSLKNSIRAVPNQRAFEEPMSQGGGGSVSGGGGGGGVISTHHMGANIRGVVNSTILGRDVVNSGVRLPLHMKLPAGCAPPVTQGHPDFLKVLESENKGPVTAADSLIIGVKQSTLSSSSHPQPLHLLQEGVATARYPPGAGTGLGGSTGDALRFCNHSAVVNAGVQQQQKPRAQVIIRSIRQQAAPVLKGIGQQVAAVPRMDGSNVLVGRTSEAGQAQHLASTCSGSVLDATGSSVLMNLLMRGVDVNYGYRLQSSHTIINSARNN